MLWTRVLTLTLSGLVSSPASSVATSSDASVSPAAPAEVAASASELEPSSVGSASEGSVCPSVTHVGLEIDGEKLGEGAEVIVDRIRRRLQATLRQWDIRPARDASHPILKVTLSRLPDYAGYDLQFNARRGEEELPDVAGSAECRVCTEDEFIEHVDEGFERLLGRLTPAPLPASSPPPPPRVARPAGDPVRPPPAPQVASRIDDPYLLRIRRAGIGLSIAGAGLVGAGAAVALMQPVLLSDNLPGARRLWVPGSVTAAVGLSALVSGIVLMVVEHRRRDAIK